MYNSHMQTNVSAYYTLSIVNHGWSIFLNKKINKKKHGQDIFALGRQ